jgi:adenine C2-methylase RlmN of 23S rRNA A2503 and tRNA A37
LIRFFCFITNRAYEPVPAKELVRLLHAIPAKLNLIPYNENPNLPFKRPDEAVVEKFRAEWSGAALP